MAVAGGVLLALPMAAQAVTPAAARAATVVKARRASTITLPTGDRVRMVPVTSGPTRVLTEPVAVRGPGRVLVTQRLGSDVFVTPAVARPYLGRFLDPNLFNVTQLTAKAKASGQLPVRIRYQGALPTPPGVTITAAAAGTARGYLTPASSAAFGRALTSQWLADAKAGWPKRTSILGNVTKISADLPGAARVTPHFPMKTLIVKAIGRDGKPVVSGVVGLVNVDDSRKYGGLVYIEGGQARVSVPTGTYSAIIDDFSYNEVTDSSSDAVTTVNEFKVSAASQTLTLDLRKATAQPSVTVPKKATLEQYTFEWDRSDAVSAMTALGFNSPFGPHDQFRAVSSKPAKVGAVHVVHGWTLAGPGSAPKYTYDLSTLDSQILAKPKYVFTEAALAKVEARYYTDGAVRAADSARIPAYSFQDSVDRTSYYPITIPVERTEYVGATGKPLWGEGIIADEASLDDPEYFEGAFRPIPAGAFSRLDWMHGPLGAGIPTQTTNGYCDSCRTSKQLDLGIAAVTDSMPDHFGQIFPASDDLPVARFRFYRNGKLVSDQDDVLGGSFSVPTAKATYRAVLDVDRRLTGSTQSTRSQTDLTFRSAAGQGGKLPADWTCGPGDASTCRVLPILQARLSIPTTLSGRMAAGKSTITVTAARVQNATPAAITSAGLEIRPAGSSWVSVALVPIGGGRYRGIIDNSDLEGYDVDVRVSAADAAGSSYRQTVLHAYRIAGS